MSKHIGSMLVLFVALFVAASCGTQQGEQTGAIEEGVVEETTVVVDAQAIRTALEDINTQWAAGAIAGDAAAVASLYSEDAIIFPPNTERVIGRAAIEAGLTTMWEGVTTTSEDITIDDLVIAESGEIAVVLGTYNSTALVGEETIESTGKYMAVAKNVHGEWKLIRDVWNSDKPAEGTTEVANPCAPE